MKIVETIFEPGDEVYVRHDPDQKMRMITGIMVRGKGYATTYEASCGETVKWFYEFELTTERNVTAATTN